jgi:hypothetical protein
MALSSGIHFTIPIHWRKTILERLGCVSIWETLVGDLSELAQDGGRG